MKKNAIFGLLVMILAINFNGCDDGSSDDKKSNNYDVSLNGSWLIWDNVIYKFEDGNFECTEGDYPPYKKGTYTTNNGQISMMVTHVSIDVVKSYFKGTFTDDIVWKSKEEIIPLRDDFKDTEITFDTWLEDTFGIISSEYSINENTLTIGEMIFTKVN